MPSVYDLKPAFQRLLRPLVAALARAGVTANQVTVAAALLSAAAGAAVLAWPQAAWPLLLYPAVLLVRMGLNAVDGMLAREHGQKSRLGALLNELGDVAADAALYLPLAVVAPAPAAWVVAAVVVAGLTEMAGVCAIQVGATRRYDGPMGKSDRAVAFGAAALLLALVDPAAGWLAPTLLVLFVLVTLLAAWTVVNRCRRALAEAGGETTR
ncbi:MAG TPA: CDP-alcohol phosphatidyltransferase family protein [Thermoanaerobaculia bacterium]|nr:CDP-alcohol phosphatidyltransferase family protein [Thermoanaerobaculia bacterium]